MKADLFTISGGNTNLSIGLHQNNSIQKILNLEELKTLLDNFPENQSTPSIGSFTRSYPELDALKLKNFQNAPHLSNDQFMDMPVNYNETIGNDRLVGSYYCFKEFSSSLKENKKMAFIDSGTFLTINIIQKKHGYLGGFIFPGLDLIKSNYSRGQNLHEPHIEYLGKKIELPHNTKDAIQFAFNHLIKSMLNTLDEHEISKTVITGGRAKEILKFLENPIHIPHLLHSALGQLHQIVRNKPE